MYGKQICPAGLAVTVKLSLEIQRQDLSLPVSGWEAWGVVAARNWFLQAVSFSKASVWSLLSTGCLTDLEDLLWYNIFVLSKVSIVFLLDFVEEMTSSRCIKLFWSRQATFLIVIPIRSRSDVNCREIMVLGGPWAKPGIEFPMALWHVHLCTHTTSGAVGSLSVPVFHQQQVRDLFTLILRKE